MKIPEKAFLLIPYTIFILVSIAIMPSGSHALESFYVINTAFMTFKGSWSISQRYSVHDVVFYAGSSWFSLKNDNKGNQPNTSSLEWTLLAKKGDDGSAGATGPQGPTGATGPQGPTGQAVQTVSVCSDGGQTGPGTCSCNSGRLVSKTTAQGYQYCRITSDSGPCIAFGGYNKTGECCICAPN